MSSEDSDYIDRPLPAPFAGVAKLDLRDVPPVLRALAAQSVYGGTSPEETARNYLHDPLADRFRDLGYARPEDTAAAIRRRRVVAQVRTLSRWLGRPR